MASPGTKGDETTDPISVELSALNLDTDAIFGYTSHFERRKAKVCPFSNVRDTFSPFLSLANHFQHQEQRALDSVRDIKAFNQI